MSCYLIKTISILNVLVNKSKVSSSCFNNWPEIIYLIRKSFNKSEFALSGLIIDSTWSIKKSYLFSLCLLLLFARLLLLIPSNFKWILIRQQSLSLQEPPKAQSTMTPKITDRLSLVKMVNMIDIVEASSKQLIPHAITLLYKVSILL